MCEISTLIATLSGTTRVEEPDERELDEFLEAAQASANSHGVNPPESRWLAIAAHALAFVRRVRTGERIDDVDTSTFAEISGNNFRLADEVLRGYANRRRYPISDTEILLLAIHFEVAIRHEEAGMTNKPKVVIGDRLGNGQNVAEGVEDAGGQAIRIEGPGADMKVGDVMHERDADIGISFCGSGGAGAITAKSKYGYEVEFGLRTIEAGVTAIKAGKRVIGFGFMDQHELGHCITTEYVKHREGLPQ